jgi:hypothetical protein
VTQGWHGRSQFYIDRHHSPDRFCYWVDLVAALREVLAGSVAQLERMGQQTFLDEWQKYHGN